MLKITIETDVGEEVIALSAEEQKAFEFVALSPMEWIRNAIRNRVKRSVDQIINETSDKQPDKINKAEKLSIVATADIKSAVVRQEELEAEVAALKAAKE